MRNAPKSSADKMPISVRKTIKDTVVRDDIVPQLARRVRSGKSTWVVYLKSSGTGSKVTLGACDRMPIARARNIAAEMVKEATDQSKSSLRTAAALSGKTSLHDFAETFLLDCATRWKASTLATNRRCVERVLIPAFGDRPLDKITREDVVSWMQDSSIADGSKNRALPVLSSLFAHAELLGALPPETNPCAGLRRKTRTFRATYLTGEDYAVLGRVLDRFETAHPDAVAAIRFLALTGCRKSEAFMLTHAMIDGNRAALPDAKSGPKSIWLGKAAQRIVRQRKHSQPLVFGTRGRPLDDTDMQPVWREARQALGMPKLRLHDLRHNFASVAVSRGHSLIVVGGLLGHKEKGSTAGYAHLADRHIERAAERVGRHFGKIMRRKDGAAPSPPKTIYAEYLMSNDRLAEFCSARDLDPTEFLKGLRKWRAATARRRAL